MCGIVGFTGEGGAAGAVEAVLEGLRRLEYRGYDSAGIAAVCGGSPPPPPEGAAGDKSAGAEPRRGGRLAVVRAAGKVASLAELVKAKAGRGTPCRAPTTAIGHTRWATHGAPTERNAHPHTDCKGSLAVVHNGIVENHAELRDELAGRGHEFRSDTDTEVIAHILEEHVDRSSMLEALRAAISVLEGTYALAVVSPSEPEAIYAARRESPLCVGVAEGATILASDAVPVLPHTRKVVYLNDGEIARLTPGGVEIWNDSGEEVEPQVTVLDWDPERAEKGGFDHFMLKEIFEQPWSIRETIRDRIDLGAEEVLLDEMALPGDRLRSFERIVIVACGTALHAGMVARNMIERTARVPVQVDNASDFRYRDPIVDSRTLVVAVSQSGETADTLGAVREAKSRGAPALGIVNVPGSSIARECEHLLPTRAGPEIGVASTKAFTSQIAALYLFAIHLGFVRGRFAEADCRRRVRDLLGVADGVQAFLSSRAEAVREIALKYVGAGNALFLGRGTGFPLALEGALKLKEISYIHAEGYHAAEMKHGPIALIDEDMPVVVLALKGRRYPKIRSNIEEVRARGGRVIALASEGDEDIRAVAEDVIHLRAESGVMNSVLAAVPLQLFAYHIAAARGLNVDQPRNLAKSVTVE